MTHYSISKTKSSRNSTIELLRIIAMFMIVAHHYAISVKIPQGQFFDSKIIMDILYSCGKLGVNLFVLITGYFLINKKSFSGSKIIKIILQVWFYSISGLIIALFLDVPVTKLAMVSCIFPVSYDYYWFATSYVVLLFLYPWLNSFLSTLSKVQYRRLILLLLFLWSFIPTIVCLPILGVSTRVMMGYADVPWFVLVYLIGGYIRLYPPTIYIRYFSATYVAVLFVVLLLSSTVLNLLGHWLKVSSFLGRSRFFYQTNNILMIVTAIAIFLFFVNLKSFNNKLVNYIASTTFGIYLFHDNSLLNAIWWNQVWSSAKFLGTNFLIVWTLFAIVTTFVCGVLFDSLRYYIFETPCFKLLSLFGRNRISAFLKYKIYFILSKL